MRRLRRLSVHQFRSYQQARIEFDGRHIALTGPNGAGKTNLLEALSFLAPGRGLRRAKLSDVLAQHGEPTQGWGVAVDMVDADDDVVSLSMLAAPPAPFRKQLKIDGEAAVTAGEASEYVRFSWATPAQDRLFLDGPGERRRFIDRMTLAYDAAHAQTAATYEKAMRQRQALLGENRQDPALLQVLEQQMSEAGVAMASARRETVSLLAAGYRALRSGAFPQAMLSLEGWLEKLLPQANAADAEDEFAARLKRSRGADTAAGRALVGPHLSDLVVIHAGKDQSARLCSTGEQKALLIGLILAHASAVKMQEGGALILLLDEIAAHLDSERRAALADLLDTLGCQAVMTGTDRELFDAWGPRAQRFHIEDATVSTIR